MYSTIIKVGVLLSALIFNVHVGAHQFTPTYPKLTPSYLEGVLYTQMNIFNRRKDVEYYEIGVFDDNWDSVSFAVLGGKLVNVKYLKSVDLEVFISKKDSSKARYICSISKLPKGLGTEPLVSSRVCSKIK